MAKTAGAVEIILHRIEKESHKYALKLNQSKCIHIHMNAIHRIPLGKGMRSQYRLRLLHRRKNQEHRGPQTRASAQNNGNMEDG